MEWNYKSKKPISNGYEDVLDDLKQYNRDIFIGESDIVKDEIIDNVFKIYRDKNIFPIQYYDDDGITSEIKKCIEKDVSFDGKTLNLKFNQGSSLCRFLFPNLSLVDCKGTVNNSPYDKFNDDKKLKRAIHFCLKHKKTNTPVVPSGIKDGLEMLGGNVATNFKPMNAKALYEKYCPQDGVIYDFACGFGGRMLGALSSKNNYRYIGVEPNTETFKNLLKLGEHIERVTNRRGRFDIQCIGSEDVNTSDNCKSIVDFAFSSPPYYSLEKYCDEDTQCYIKYATVEDWFYGYVTPTIEKTNFMLKRGGFYAVNIADFKLGKRKVNLVERWIKIAEENGLEFVECIDMKLQSRRGVGHSQTNARDKKEGIFVFKKA